MPVAIRSTESAPSALYGAMRSFENSNCVLLDELSLIRNDAMRHHVSESIASPSVTVWGVPLKAGARAVEAVVLLVCHPAFLQDLIENLEEVLWRSGRTARDWGHARVGARVGLAWVDQLYDDPLERDHMFHDALTLWQGHRVVGCVRHAVCGVQPAEHFAQSAWITSGALRPQLATGSQLRTHFCFDKVVGRLRDLKAAFFVARESHFIMLAPPNDARVVRRTVIFPERIVRDGAGLG